jgi:hypothetical protein
MPLSACRAPFEVPAAAVGLEVFVCRTLREARAWLGQVEGVVIAGLCAGLWR